MNLSVLDLSIIFATVLLITIAAIATRRYTVSVADFLAANRLGGRYLLTVSEGMLALGTAGTVAAFEMYYQAGFTPWWWSISQNPILLGLAMAGWVLYRYRETRAMTLGQFFETRYSKNFRVFMGMLGWFSGIINFGIFPAVGANFFIYFLQLPPSFNVLGLACSTFAILMLFLLLIALFFTFIGGQIAVMVTDFLQGVFCNIAIVIILGYLLWKFNWNIIFESMQNAPPGKSLLNPYDTAKLEGFNLWFWMIAYFGCFYYAMAWQGNQAFNCSAKSAHEIRMAKVLSYFRTHVMMLFFLVLAVSAYAVMHHGSYINTASTVNASLDTALASVDADPNNLTHQTLRTQMTVPIVLGHIFPVGLVGLFAALMLAGFIGTHNTALHSWGCIFVQDVVVPLLKKPLTPAQHIRLLRLSICFVAFFAYCFSLSFRQSQYLYMFFIITGSIYLAGVGSVIIGGLYWKRGTTAGAWAAMIWGAIASFVIIIIQQIWPTLHNGTAFPVNSQYMAFFISIIAIVLYVVISLLGKKTVFNLEKMLHRGKYGDSSTPTTAVKSTGLAALGFSKNLPFKDKLVFIGVIIWFFGLFVIFVILSLKHMFHRIPESEWSTFWKIFVWASYVMTVGVTIWFTIGGFKDFHNLISDLRQARRNHQDDGTVMETDSSKQNANNNIMINSEITK